ncbi:HlyD family type I secretion periplasmic adaptor subunit [Hyphomicrobium sp. CS1GBMeth3]|uniref:HlyD family type I secretion periplasmic adaptor subunit n=1 Tax=Hyphomicrobium sp. CS1GBMeth3 TaxID=1892845 RepID=UPI00111500B5|nr:HlyD family type I secretion periplasmic adaptor subunit [Hyphomicrobium sp. CS1GBMeth3]
MELPSLDQWHHEVPRSNKKLVLWGGGILAVLSMGFGAWALYAPLEGAVVASGSFVATGQNKHVQHLEGGIVEEVLVREGELVQKGQVLLRLDETAARTRLTRLSVRHSRLLAIRARLEAEIDDSPEINFPDELKHASANRELADVMSRQKVELQARRTKLSAEQDVLQKEIGGLREGIRGYEAQVQSAESRLKLFKEELRDKAELLARQLARKTDMLAIQRAEAALVGELGELSGRIADAHERIARAQQQMVSLHSAAVQKAVEELRQTETELDDISEQLRAAEDVVNRIEVRSPVEGAVVKLNFNTSGGVIAPGAVILELLPMNEDLLIEAHISPREIAHVHNGQDAMVRLSALNQRITPMLPGQVIYLSPDSITENEGASARASTSRSGPSFVVRVKLDTASSASMLPGFKPTPGMPADLFIKTEERTFFDYIMRPVFDSFARAFRET